MFRTTARRWTARASARLRNSPAARREHIGRCRNDCRRNLRIHSVPPPASARATRDRSAACSRASSEAIHRSIARTGLTGDVFGAPSIAAATKSRLSPMTSMKLFKRRREHAEAIRTCGFGGGIVHFALLNTEQPCEVERAIVPAGDLRPARD